MLWDNLAYADINSKAHSIDQIFSTLSFSYQVRLVERENMFQRDI